MANLPRFMSSVILLIMAGAGMGHSEKVVPDLFPLAAGNSWTLSLRAGGTREYVIALVNKDSLIFIQKDTSNGFSRVDTFPILFHDSLGYFNHPLFRDLSNTLWGPHCAMAKDGPLATPAGMFSETFVYQLSWGHPNGGNQSVIASPGVGLLAIAWTDLMGCENEIPYCLVDTFALLQSYQIYPKPEAAWHDTIPALPDEPAFAFSYLNGDSGRAAFKMTQNSCAKSMISSSFNDVTKVLRIYFVDTSKIDSPSTVTVHHSLKLRNLKKDSIYTIAIFSGIFDTLTHLTENQKYQLKTERKYFERITCVSTSIASDRNKTPTKSHTILRVYSLKGRLVFKYHQGFPGSGRLPGPMSHGIYIVQSDRGITIVPSILTRM